MPRTAILAKRLSEADFLAVDGRITYARSLTKEEAPDGPRIL